MAQERQPVYIVKCTHFEYDDNGYSPVTSDSEIAYLCREDAVDSIYDLTVDYYLGYGCDKEEAERLAGEHTIFEVFELQLDPGAPQQKKLQLTNESRKLIRKHD